MCGGFELDAPNWYVVARRAEQLARIVQIHALSRWLALQLDDLHRVEQAKALT